MGARASLADSLGPVRTGPGRWRAARFTVAQAVIGGGAVRAWYRRYWWATTRGRLGSTGAWSALLKTPVRVARDTLRTVRLHGPACAAAYGVPLGTQYVQQLWLALAHGLDGESYYRYWLFRPDRRRRARHYVQWQEAAILYRVLAAREAPDDLAVLEDKGRFGRWCNEQRLPSAPVLAELRNGTLIGRSGAPSLPDRDLFSKPASEYGGVGVRLWQRVGAGAWREGGGGTAHDASSLLAALAEQSHHGAVILQPRLENHPSVRALAPRALCTVRLLTARPPDGPPELVLAAFRTGAGRSASDNFSAGGIAVAVDIATGRLRSGVRMDEQLLIAREVAHPDTGAAFANFVLPQWREMQALALDAHSRLRSMPFVGWDVAVTTDGLVLIEGNYNPGVRIVQAGDGVPLGETNFAMYLDAHLRRSFAR